MATTLSTQVLVDSNKRALIKYVGTGGGDSGTLLDASGLAFSLNANGYIMSSNTHIKPTYRHQIKRVWGQGQIAEGKSVILKWANTTDSIVSFGNGNFNYNFDAEASPASIPLTTNANGDIGFTSTAGSTDSWTLFIDLKKDARDYDAGQTADPYAFNKGVKTT